MYRHIWAGALAALLITLPAAAKPTASRQVSMTSGVKVVFSKESGQSTVYGVTWALDLMFWPWRHAGFWIEPSNDVYFRDRATLGVGSTGGVLFGF